MVKRCWPSITSRIGSLPVAWERCSSTTEPRKWPLCPPRLSAAALRGFGTRVPGVVATFQATALQQNADGATGFVAVATFTVCLSPSAMPSTRSVHPFDSKSRCRTVATSVETGMPPSADAATAVVAMATIGPEAPRRAELANATGAARSRRTADCYNFPETQHGAFRGCFGVDCRPAAQGASRARGPRQCRGPISTFLLMGRFCLECEQRARRTTEQHSE